MRRRRHGPGIGWLVLTLCAITSSATDARASSARIELTRCSTDLGVAVEAALDVELSMAEPDVRRGLDDGTLRCALECDPAGTTASVVTGTARVTQRIEGQGPGHARRLALALAELLDASVAPLPASAPVVLREAPPAPREDARSESLETRIRIAGGAWLGGQPFLALGALELGAELAPTSNLAVVLGASGALGAIDVERGRLDVRLLSLSASLRFGARSDAFWLGGGPAVRGGVVLWTGVPDASAPAVGRDVTGAWLGLGAVAVVLLSIGDTPIRAGFEVEGGGVAFSSGALVLGALAAQIGGGWIETRVVLDLSFD